MLSHALWRDLGADEAIVGKALRLGGVTRTVVGVMPPGFWFPSPTTQIWTTAAMTPENRVGPVHPRRPPRGWAVDGPHGRSAAVRSSDC